MDLDHIGAFFAIFANRYLALALLSYLIITEYKCVQILNEQILGRKISAF